MSLARSEPAEAEEGPQRQTYRHAEAHAQAEAEANADTAERSLAGALIPDARHLLQWLTAYELRIAEAATRSAEKHCGLWGVPFTRDASRAWYVAREAWLEPTAPVSAFASRGNRLALLDAAWLRRVLAARAVYASRGLLRRIVSGATRRALNEALGERALTVLMQLGVNAAASICAELPADLAVDALARAGCALFERDDAWTLAHARSLIAFALDRGKSDEPAFATPDTDESEEFMLACGMLFPELTWLFG